MECVKCKKNIDDGDLYCGYCGVNQAKFSKYIEKIDNKIHKERDKEYNLKVKSAQNKLKQLQKSREDEIQRIIKTRWQPFANNAFSYNTTEGKVIINGSTYLFSDIKGAEIVKEDSFRTVTNTVQTGKNKSRKHVSLGGGIAGAVVAGPIGAVVGGSVLGKKTSKGKTNIVSNSNNIPTCYHIGVDVDLNGFNTEIVLLSNTIDQTSTAYNSIISDAQIIMDKLRNLSQTPVPKNFLKPEEEQSVINIDNAIDIAAKELRKVSEDKPNYDIPESYYE